MLKTDHLEHILFLDIETVSSFPDFHKADERVQSLWTKKAASLQRWSSGPDLDAAALYADRAAIFAEFARVVCLSVGYLKRTSDHWTIRLKSWAGAEEGAILEGFREVCETFMARPVRRLCAHNGKEFDFPFLGRRYLANGLAVPTPLRVQELKPWEVPFLDTMEMWRFGDRRSFVSLDLLTQALGIESPKTDMTGADVGDAFWVDGDHDRITRYCEQDVIATAQVMLRFCGQTHSELEVEHSPDPA